MDGYIIIRDRLCLTEDGDHVVPEGHPDARWLWATPGHRISRADAERFGLLEDGHDVADLQAVPTEATAGGLTITVEAPEPVEQEQEGDAEQEQDGDAGQEGDAEQEQGPPPPPRRPGRRK